MDRDNGIFYEMLTYPISRAEYLLGKVLFNIAIGARAGAGHRRCSPTAVLGVALRPGGLPAARRVGHRRHRGLVLLLRDLRAGHPPQRRVQHGDVDLLLRVPVRQLDVLPDRSAAAAFRVAALANPITWHVDVMRFATIGLGDPRQIALEAAGFVAFTLASFAGALYVLRRQGD